MAVNATVVLPDASWRHSLSSRISFLFVQTISLKKSGLNLATMKTQKS